MLEKSVQNVSGFPGFKGGKWKMPDKSKVQLDCLIYIEYIIF